MAAPRSGWGRRPWRVRSLRAEEAVLVERRIRAGSTVEGGLSAGAEHRSKDVELVQALFFPSLLLGAHELARGCRHDAVSVAVAAEEPLLVKPLPVEESSRKAAKLWRSADSFSEGVSGSRLIWQCTWRGVL